MSVKGKTRDEWVAVTLTDFGDPTSRQELRHHYSLPAAARAWDGIIKIYGRPWPGRKPSRVWQETRDGKVINESQDADIIERMA